MFTVQAAKKYHPDAAAAAGELSASDKYKFHEIQEAYEILGDKAKRIGYDIETGRRQSTTMKR